MKFGSRNIHESLREGLEYDEEGRREEKRWNA